MLHTCLPLLHQVLGRIGEVAVICKRAHRIITPYAEKLVGKHGTFKGNAILANQIARAVYYMVQSGQAFDAERLVAHRS